MGQVLSSLPEHNFLKKISQEKFFCQRNWRYRKFKVQVWLMSNSAAFLAKSHFFKRFYNTVNIWKHQLREVSGGQFPALASTTSNHGSWELLLKTIWIFFVLEKMKIITGLIIWILFGIVQTATAESGT